ncbi:helix-turn-helix domain-containing protein [Agaribacterium sp. ZY112]|uniref:helix-turn-helix domain-containing protein n=1 Tax=Agaribacterium sp. ZY112 TaxID=3233574 RepID=UPI003523245E
MLWLYVLGLTCEQRWSFQKKHLWHFVPSFIGLACSISLLSLPAELRDPLLLKGQDDVLDTSSGIQHISAVAALILAFGLILFWILQSACYLAYSFLSLKRYQQRLKDLFSSNEQRELGWLSVLILALALTWLLSISTIIAGNFFGFKPLSNSASYGIIWLMVWVLALWGSRQQPGFEGRYLHEDELTQHDSIELTQTPDINQEEADSRKLTSKQARRSGGNVADKPSSPQASNQEGLSKKNPNTNKANSPKEAHKNKYERSALGHEHSQRLAQKIELAMSEHKLYLDNSISLQKLCQHLNSSSNYVSQTLNETIGLSFFDYINKWRIRAAKPLIAQAELSVLDVAMEVGFNARSSFYTAFKKETGLTPSQFRKQANTEDIGNAA